MSDGVDMEQLLDELICYISEDAMGDLRRCLGEPALRDELARRLDEEFR